MARIFKQTYTKPMPDEATCFTGKGRRYARFKDARGRTRTAQVTGDGTRITLEASRYYIDYRGGSGRQRRVAGFTDKRASEQKAADLKRQAERERAGIIDRQSINLSQQSNANIDGHIEAYHRHLQTSGVSDWHLSETIRRLERMVADCHFGRLSDIEPDPIQSWCLERQADDMSARTRNTYTGSLRAFVRWCVKTARMANDPLETLVKADEKADARRIRRAFTEPEFAGLLTAARDRPLAEAMTIRRGPRKGQRIARLKPHTIEQLTRLGHERALIYKILVLTGLRSGELASLTWGDLALDRGPAWLTVRARNAKSRKEETLPIRSDLAAELRKWRDLQGHPANGELVVRVSPNQSRQLELDLKFAGIPKYDADGRVIDAHALRHTTATYLAKAGVAPRTAQAIMRHSDIRLTLGAYTDPRLLDQAAGLDALPTIDETSAANVLPPTGTDSGSQL